jgi:uncharacterized protein YdaU (DUF1376 family)
MADLAWFPMYPNDFLVSTATMTPVQGWAYTQLLMYAWTNGGIPDDHAACAALTRCLLTEADWEVIRSRFTPMGSPMATLSHPRMERERVKAREKHNTASESGKRGAEARWGSRNGVANGNANGVANADAMAITTTTTTTDIQPPLTPPSKGGSRLRREKFNKRNDPNWVPF